ncbi:MAG: YdeI/OmpD-associated family protein [Candidatus Aenigmarchaeota archaeon]|nr:YdeI/OmpD-associated family protein [Candidatus Aenigmarchaeota archaeon]
METKGTFYASDRRAWRKWLEANHARRKEVWLIYYKKGTGKARIPYDDAVEEALCFGWIDGQIKRLDTERFMQRFCPRRKRSVWAESNINRVKKMIKLGKMTPAGLEKFACHEKTRVPSLVGMPNDVEKALKADKKAWENFRNFPPSHRKHFLWWVISSRRPETRRRRIAELVKRASENRKLVP